jgi:hypothetical protein
MKQFVLPDYISYDKPSLNYATSLIDMQKHATSLNQQILFSEIFKTFIYLPDLISFQLQIDTLDYKFQSTENEFAPSIKEPLFSFNFNNIFFKNNILPSNIEQVFNNSIENFRTFLNGIEQEKVLLWIWKRGKEENKIATRASHPKHTYIFEFNKEFSILLCKDAYKENYNNFYNESLQFDKFQSE